MRDLNFLQGFTILFFAMLAGGCAIGGGASAGLLVDTRGSIGVMASVRGFPWGMRQSDTAEGHEAALGMMPLEVGGGYDFNPKAATLHVRIPGMGYTFDNIDDEWGLQTSLNAVFDMKWPVEGEFKGAFGAGLATAWLPHLDHAVLPRHPNRPEWPDPHRIHRLGPGLSVNVLYDDEGVYGQFFLGAVYDVIEYFTIGL